jgi:hypothetical protein
MSQDLDHSYKEQFKNKFNSYKKLENNDRLVLFNHKLDKIEELINKDGETFLLVWYKSKIKTMISEIL